MRWGAHRFRSWVSSRKTHHRASAEGLGAMLSSQHRSQSVFFHHSHAQPSILAWAQDCSLNPGVATGLPEKPITGPAPKVRQRCCPRSIADGVFFFSPLPAVATGLLHPILLWQQGCSTQSCCATGLLHPILLWQQDCHCQSWAGRRIASPIPALTVGLPRCTTSSSGLELFFPEHRLVMESARL